MIVSLFMFGWTADEQTQKNYRCKKTVSQIKKGHTRTHTHYAYVASDQSLTDAACFPKLRTHSVLGRTSL